MSALEVGLRYFGAWNARNPEAVVAALAGAGTHEDPTSGGPIGGEALLRHANRLFATFPDVSFEIVSASEAADHSVAVQWRMVGTNTGSLMGAGATGRGIDLRGADFISVDGEEIASVRRYFDQMAFVSQLGMHLTMQTPFPMEKVDYGNSAYTSLGKPVPPGAISLTWIAPRSNEERERLRSRIERIMLEMPQTEGFLSMMIAGCAGKMYTSASWTDAKAAEAMSTRGAHLEGMQEFWKGDLGSSSMTSIWVPYRINGPHVRCTGCDIMADYSRDEGRCACGVVLPEPPPYW